MLRIKEVMREKGVTGKQLADALGVSPQYISGIVRETGSASVEALSKIAKQLGVPVASLFDDYDAGVKCSCPHCGKPINVILAK